MSTSIPQPQVPNAARIAASSLSDTELAYVVDLLKVIGAAGMSLPPSLRAPLIGWSVDTDKRIWDDFREAAKIRGIVDGVKAVTRTIELRS